MQVIFKISIGHHKNSVGHKRLKIELNDGYYPIQSLDLPPLGTDENLEDFKVDLQMGLVDFFNNGIRYKSKQRSSKSKQESKIDDE